MSSNNFVPVNEKLKRLIPDPVELDAYNHFCTIIERMIINGHEAHKTIPDFDKCKPEIEAYKVFDGIQIPVHGYADLKGKMVIEDKCKFPKQGRLKKDNTRSWLTVKLPDKPTSDHLLQTDFYHYATGLPDYICYINEETFKVFHADNYDLLKPESMMSRLPDFLQRCKVRQNLLSISNDAKVIKDYIQPDFENFKWKNELDPDYVKNAINFWKS